MWSQRVGYNGSDLAAVAKHHTHMRAHMQTCACTKTTLSKGTTEAGISVVTMRFQIFSILKVLLTG